jgi:type I restriction enzyme M protein
MMKYTSPDVSREVGLVLSIANKLRGAYTADKYKDVIIPMIIIRRFECALTKNKDAVVSAYKENPNLPPQKLESLSGYKFYNISPYTLEELLNDADNIVSKFKEYIKGFSENIRKILDNLAFEKQLDKMDTHGRLLAVVREFADLDLDPERIDNTKVGYIFEEVIRKYSENAEAGDHYTPREVIRLLVSIMLAEGCDSDLVQRMFA